MTMGAEAVAATIPLIRATGDASETVRENAVGVLEEIGTPDVGELNALRELVHAEQEDVAYWSTTLIGRLGEDAAAAVPDLAKAVAESPALQVRQRAAWALGKIGPSRRIGRTHTSIRCEKRRSTFGAFSPKGAR